MDSPRKPKRKTRLHPYGTPTSVALLLLGLAFLSCNNNDSASLPVIDGRAKISYSELEQTGPLSLHGTWSFVPSGKPSPLPSAGAHSIQVPGTWKDTDFESEDGDAVHRQGMYQLVLEMDNPRPLSLRFTEVMTESCVYLDGDLVRCQGQPGSDSRTSVANTTPFVVVLFPESSQSLIQIQVSNNHHRKGGIFGTVKIGTIKQIQDLDRQRMSRYLLVAGGLLLTALYFGLMALFERRGGSNLSLAIFCTVVLLRILTSGEKPVVSFYPDIPYALYLKIQYMTYFFSVAVALHHIHAMFPEDTIKRILVGVYGLALSFSIFALFADGTTLSYSLSYYVFIFFGTALYSLYAVIRATLNRRIGSRLILFGMVSLLVAAIVDFLRVYEVVLIPYLIGDAILILILCQAVATSLQNRNVHLRMGELQRERDVADAAARNNREFLSRMSHELRTPLHSIVHIGHLLREEQDAKRVAEYIQTLQSASDHLLTLVNDVLDFNRLAQGKLRYQEGSFSLRLLVNRVALIHRERAAGRGLTLTVQVDESMPDRFLGDAHRISQVLHNLLGNAIKFTESGSIDLSVARGHSLERPGVRFSVTDTGIGLLAEQIPDIFESYFQGGFQADRKHEGTGLGLAISRELVRLMGGELHVRSEPGSGSEFFFELPLLQDRSTGRILELDEISQAVSLAEMESGETEKRKFRGELIFVVDDNPDNRRLTGRFLERWNLQFREADGGRQCLSLLQEDYPHLILLDLHMPEMDGFATLAAIRNNGYTGPVIAATADVSNETRIKIDAAGFDGFIGKPFSPNNFYQILTGYLQPGIRQ